MDTTIKTGSLLIEDGTVLPDSMQFKSTPYSSGWTSLTDLGRRSLEKELDQAGWTFFYMAGRIKTSAFGFDEQKRMRTAVERAMRDVQSQNCNCLEIGQVTAKSFLGVPYVSLSAHSRHIQNGTVFRAPEMRNA
jgi:hypothetical protein